MGGEAPVQQTAHLDLPHTSDDTYCALDVKRKIQISRFINFNRLAI